MTAKKADQRLASQFAVAAARGTCVAPNSQRDYQLLRRRKESGTVLEPFPRLFAPADFWGALGDRQRYLYAIRSMAEKHPDWIFSSFSAAVIHGLAVSKKQLKAVHINSPREHC